MSETLPSLERLGGEFERIARERPRRRVLTRRAGLFAAAGALLVSAVALAASGILTGSPVRNPRGFPKPRPHVAFGVVRPDSIQLTALRVADPVGGPSWGLRTMATTRAFGCIQIGRVVSGRLGVLGQDGAFGNDGKFHELPPEVYQGRDCELLDGAGRPFIAVSYQGLAASGPVAACASARPIAQVPQCPHQDMRIVYYGTLGPRAESVTYDDRGVRRTAATSGPFGAYLVVVRPDHKHPARGYFVPGTSPGSGLVAVTYRDGHQCRIRSPRLLGGAKPCPRVGYVPPPSRTVTDAQVATPVSARFSARPVRPRIGPNAQPEGPKTWVLTVSFTARVAAGPRSFYFVTLTLPRRSCGDSGGIISSPIAHDVRAAEQVRATVYVPTRCVGALRGQVRFQNGTDSGAPAPFASSNDRHTRSSGATQP